MSDNSLPFDTNKNTRKYQCFCCGREFKSCEQYVSHITSEHEEGRDYVRCAIEWCQVPVRDLKMHYKVQHKGETIPPMKMTKAIIWRDPNPRNGKMESRKPTFRRGYYVSTKTGKAHYYRSGWEERVYEILDSMPNVVGFDAEPLNIQYFYDGEMRRYIPDIVVLFTDGHKELWEIKPSSQTSLEINECKWEAARSFCLASGWHFRVITEVAIETMKHGLNTMQKD